MNTIFMNSKNCKTSDPYRLLLNLTDKTVLRRKQKYIALSNLSNYYIKNSYKNNKFKISAPTQNEEFELLDGLYSISHIQNYYEQIPRKHGEKTVNPVIKIYVNKIENKITFKIKTGYYLKILTLEAAKLFGSTNSNIYFYS